VIHASDPANGNTESLAPTNWHAHIDRTGDLRASAVGTST